MSELAFKRTARAAHSERLSKWDLIAAIAEDAVEADLPITGIDSILEAKRALDAAGNEYADNTIKSLCFLAKFDYESDAPQREVWRRYGWATVVEVAKAGWTPEAGVDLLDGERKSHREVRAALVASSDVATGKPASFDDRCAEWVGRLLKVLMDGRALATEAEGVDSVGSQAALALHYLAAINDKVTDAELRQILTEEAVK